MDQETPPRPMFETGQLAIRRDRADAAFAAGADVLHREVAGLVAERLAEVTRDFAETAVIGSGGGVLAAAIAPRVAGPIRQLEVSPRRAARAGVSAVDTLDPLPLEPGSQDLVLSALELHWANDPVGQLIQMRRALRPDGLMLAALFGGQTLAELRSALATAESELTGGLAPRIAPMGEIRDLGALLQRVGFALPVADAERMTLRYCDALHLMHDLRAMGETNILADRHRAPLPRAVVARTCEIYAEHFSDDEGRVRATFEIVFLTGWAPAANQPKPLRPGSAKARLADALGTTEHPAGEGAAPRLKDT